ncbi:MAG TPA: hypothetical protein VFB76_06570 [Candidatus Angelobacter sp.]|nr:hypothetical protein [Candidatus Angelobacter sp.]
MPIRDDEQFEKYLKQFQPVSPEPLLAKEQVKARRRPVGFAAWAAVAAAIVIALMMSALLHRHALPVKETGPSMPPVEEFNNPQPLTIGRADALLANAPSFKAAVDDMAFRPESKPISAGRYSALALLSKEEVNQ